MTWLILAACKLNWNCDAIESIAVDRGFGKLRLGSSQRRMRLLSAFKSVSWSVSSSDLSCSVWYSVDTLTPDCLQGFIISPFAEGKKKPWLDIMSGGGCKMCKSSLNISRTFLKLSFLSFNKQCFVGSSGLGTRKYLISLKLCGLQFNTLFVQHTFFSS